MTNLKTSKKNSTRTDDNLRIALRQDRANMEQALREQNQCRKTHYSQVPITRISREMQSIWTFVFFNSIFLKNTNKFVITTITIKNLNFKDISMIFNNLET